MMLTLALLAISADGAAIAQEYATYVNKKYGYEMKYPKGEFTPLEGAENDRGAVFMSEGKHASMRVSAKKDVFDTGPKYEYENLLGSDVLEKNFNGEAGWFTVETLEGQAIVYVKKILKDGVYYTLEIEYPQAKKAEFGPMVHTISDSFRVLPESGN